MGVTSTRPTLTPPSYSNMSQSPAQKSNWRTSGAAQEAGWVSSDKMSPEASVLPLACPALLKNTMTNRAKAHDETTRNIGTLTTPSIGFELRPLTTSRFVILFQ